MDEVDAHAKKIWDYMLMHHSPAKADALFVLGSNDVRVAERAAELYALGLAPRVLISGGNGKASEFNRPEAEVFSEVAIQHGVPREALILEPHATNTGENIALTRKLLKERGLELSSFILVQKPYMERRTYATFRKQWPDATCVVTSPQLTYEEYAGDDATFKTRFINVMVGDLQRIKEYPSLGYQIPQEIPEEIWESYERLVELGYTKYVMQL